MVLEIILQKGVMCAREYHIAPSRPERVRPPNNLLSRNVFASNVHHLELIVHSKHSTCSPIISW